MNWQTWVGPAIGLASLIWGLIWAIMNRKPKRLEYQIHTDQEIITRSPYIRWAALSVQFDNRQLKHPRVVGVRVINTGKVEARADDFDEPLTVGVPSGAEIVAATITLRQRAGDKSQEIRPLRVDTQEVVAPKALINKGDWLEFRLLVDGNKKPEVRGRIAGFDFAPYIPRRWMSSTGRMLYASSLLLAVVCAFVVVNAGLENKSHYNSLIIGTALFSVVATMFWLWSETRASRPGGA